MKLAALLTISLAACMPMGGQSAPPPTPMNDQQALAYAHAHPYTGGNMMTAVNHLAVPVCRLVFLAVEQRKPYVNQAGATDPNRGNLDPTDEPLLQPGKDSPVFFPNVTPSQSSMVVTAFGCERTEKHLGMYVVDQKAVLYQETVPVAVNATLVLDKRK